MKYIIYYRVSTKKQGESGLGLKAQKNMAENATRDGEVVAEYTEIESGKNADRPKLDEAIKHCRRTGATLVVAKLDRLARNVLFTARLMESGLQFVCCDMPSANPMTIHIIAAIAEGEAKMISDRTKAGLAAAKAKGTLLGSARPGHWDGREHRRGWAGCKDKDARKRKNLKDSYGPALSMIRVLRGKGDSYQSIADTLNEEGFETSKGCQWRPSAVQRVYERDQMVAA